ncbi:MAG: glycosyltransferase family 4 protein [Exilispira sp.]|jgi:glycosyltransferase involved in cell wall biosynthesis|nr:glycosyltransferase family 4 protein [Exilispira sp.]
MGKNIWILNHYARPNIYPGGTRHYDISKYLVKNGYQVTIFSSSFLHGKDLNILSNNQKYKIEFYEGVRFFWINTKPLYEGNGIKRFLNMISYLILVLRYSKVLNEKPDVVIGSSVHLFACLTGVILSKKYKSGLITEIRDIWPQSLVEIGSLSKFHPVVLFFSIIERYIYSKSKYIITLLENSTNYFIKKGLKLDQISYIPNGVDIEEYSYNKNNFKSPFEFDKTKINFCYCGAHGKANALNNIIEACNLLNSYGFSEKYIFNFIGDGPEKVKLIERSRELKLNNIRFYNPVPKKEIPSILQNIDILVFNLMKLTVLNNGLSPNKLFDYMCSGKFIISACNEEVDLVKKASCGINVEPENPEKLAEAMKKAIELDSNDRNIIGYNGFEYVKKHHDIKLLSKKLIELIEKTELL